MNDTLIEGKPMAKTYKEPHVYRNPITTDKVHSSHHTIKENKIIK
jgi:hypothetical protein